MAFLDSLKQGLKDAQSKVDELRGTELEKKVKKLTSAVEKWESTSTQKHEIAQATHDYSGYKEVMSTLWKRLNDPDKNWIVIIKSLGLLEYLIRMGSERVVEECRERLYQIRTWQEYSFVDKDDRDRGAAIRQKAKELADLLQDEDKIKKMRQESAQNLSKYVGVSNSGDVSRAGFGSYGGGGSSYSGGGAGAFDSQSSDWRQGDSYDSSWKPGNESMDRDREEDKPKKSHHKKHGEHHHKHDKHDKDKDEHKKHHHRKKHSDTENDEEEDRDRSGYSAAGGSSSSSSSKHHSSSHHKHKEKEREKDVLSGASGDDEAEPDSGKKKKPIKIKMSEKSERKKASRAPAIAPPGQSDDDSEATPKPKASSSSSKESSSSSRSAPPASSSDTLFDPFRVVDEPKSRSGFSAAPAAASDEFGDFNSFNPRSGAAAPARPQPAASNNDGWDTFASAAPPARAAPANPSWDGFDSFQSGNAQRSQAPVARPAPSGFDFAPTAPSRPAAQSGGFDLFDTPNPAPVQQSVNVNDAFFGGGGGGGDDFGGFQSAEKAKPMGSALPRIEVKEAPKKSNTNDAWDIGSGLVNLNLGGADKGVVNPKPAASGPAMSAIRGVGSGPISGPLSLPEARNAPLTLGGGGGGGRGMGPVGPMGGGFGGGGFGGGGFPPMGGSAMPYGGRGGYPPMGGAPMGGMGGMGPMGGMGGMGPMGGMGGMAPMSGFGGSAAPRYPAPGASGGRGLSNDPFNFSM